MKALLEALDKNLAKAKKIVVIGVGSEFRGDDGSGIYVTDRVERALGKRTARSKVIILRGDTAPENLTGEIRRLKPSHVLFVDSAEIGKKAGEAAFLTQDEIVGITFSTHALPLGIMADYLRGEMPVEFFFIGIQPKTIRFGLAMSSPIKRGSTILARTLTAFFKKFLSDRHS